VSAGWASLTTRCDAATRRVFASWLAPREKAMLSSSFSTSFDLRAASTTTGLQRRILPKSAHDRIANCICAYVFGFLISKHMGMRCDREPLETSPTSERFTAPSQHTSHIELLTSALCRHIRKHIFSFFSHETLTLLTPTTVSSMRSQVLQSDVYRSRAYDSSTGTTNMYYGKDYSAFLVIMPGKAMMPAYRFGHVRSGA
jgi:hypothetical protein